MKLLFFNDFKLGVLKGDNNVVDVSQLVRDIPHTGPHNLISGLIERFADYRGACQNYRQQGHLEQVRSDAQGHIRAQVLLFQRHVRRRRGGSYRRVHKREGQEDNRGRGHQAPVLRRADSREAQGIGHRGREEDCDQVQGGAGLFVLKQEKGPFLAIPPDGACFP